MTPLPPENLPRSGVTPLPPENLPRSGVTPPKLSLDARLGLDKYEIDEQQSHIQVDGERCKLCELKPCLTVCPAGVYTWVDEHVAVRYENCLECGTCQISCDTGGKGGITWRNPQGGFGILFRYG